MTSSVHVFRKTTDPVAAPTDLGQHWVNTVNGKHFLSNGTASVANWEEQSPDTGITELTGDGAAGPGSGSQALTLATVNSNVGAFTNASVTVNGKGLVTAASSGTAPVTSVGATAPITSTGGVTPTIALQAPTTSAIAASDIDWSVLGFRGGLYTKTLAANTTFTFSNAVAGQCITVKVLNTASNWTVTWPTAYWAPNGTTQPVQTIGDKWDIYTFIYDGTNYSATVIQAFG